MDDIFKDLQKEKKNDVDSLVKWIKDSKLIDSTKEAEDKARNLFKDAADAKNIELDKFKTVVQKLAEDQKKNFDELAKQLADEGPKLMKAAMAGVSAFKDAMTAPPEKPPDLEKQAEKLISDAAGVVSDEMGKLSSVVKRFAEGQRGNVESASSHLMEEVPKIVMRFAEDQKANIETATNKIMEELPKIGSAVMNGVSAFLEALKGK